MNILWTLAAIVAAISGFFFLKNSLLSDAGAKGVTEGKTKSGDAAFRIIGGFLIILAVIIFFQQINAALGLNGQDPYVSNWLEGILKQIASGGLPTLK